MEINGSTKVCAIFGNPVSHSMSPAIHNAAFRKLNLNYVYTAFNVEDLKNAVDGVRALGIRGLSVTIPHKEAIIPLLDEVDDFAESIGAVNTVVNDFGVLKGYNTDASGVLYALKDGGINLNLTNVVIIGSGGAARAAGFAVAMKGNIDSLDIIDPIKGKAAALAQSIKGKAGFSKVTGHILSDNLLKDMIDRPCLIINASPIGMHPDIDASPVPVNMLNVSHRVFDIVYNPSETMLIKKANEAGAVTVTGDKMFLKQAQGQFILWTGLDAPFEIMRDEFLKAINGK